MADPLTGDDLTALDRIEVAEAVGGIMLQLDIPKVDGTWRIGSLRIAMFYEEGDREVRAHAIRRMADRLGSSAEDLTVIGRSPTQVGT